jgi:hypothetical protein
VRVTGPASVITDTVTSEYESELAVLEVTETFEFTTFEFTETLELEVTPEPETVEVETELLTVPFVATRPWSGVAGPASGARSEELGGSDAVEVDVGTQADAANASRMQSTLARSPTVASPVAGA